MKFPLAEQLGKPGIAALGLFAFCAVLYAAAIRPAMATLDELQQKENDLATRAASRMDEIEARPTMATPPIVRLPPMTAAPELLKSLNRIAEKHGVVVETASYSLSNVDGHRQMVLRLPLKTTYPVLRAYLREVLNQPTPISLDEVNLQRRQASEELIEVELQLSYYFLPAP